MRCERAEEDPELSYAEEEVVVECVAYTVCGPLGLDTGGDTQMLGNGARIAKTQSAIVLEKLISQFMFDKAASGGAPAPAAGTASPAVAAGAAK